MIGVLTYENNFLENQYLEELSKTNKEILLIKETNELTNNYSRNWKLQTNGFFEKKNYSINYKKIKTLFVSSHNSKKMLHLIKSFKIKTIINIGTTKKISKKIISSLKYGIINIHPGLIPYYRGSQCVEWAIYNDHPIYLTAHFMSAEYDLGRIINYKKINTKNIKTYSKMRIKVYLNQSKLISKILNNIDFYKNKNLSLKKIKFIKMYPTVFKKISFNKLNLVIKKINNKKYKFQ